MSLPESDQSTLRLRRTPVMRLAEADTEAHLVVLVGHALGRRFTVQDRFEIGRGTASPIEILDEGVSRSHAVVTREKDGKFRIEDLGSRNGTFVNGEKVQSATLRYGDKIAVGSQTVLLFASRDRFEDQRIQAQKLQALGQLAGGIAHDFNNLLGVVLANVTHLQAMSELPEDQVRSTLVEVETAARRAVDLTNQLLAFARSGQRRSEPTEVAPLIVDARRLLRRTLHRSIDIDANTASGLSIVGDPTQLLQVLMNLCINAGDAMPDGGKLEISAHPRSVTPEELESDGLVPPGDYVVIRVVDNGIGMDEQTVERIFEPFYTTKPRGKGTGLGLATAYAIVRDHGGCILVDSTPGEGTVFEVLIPAATSTPAAFQRLTEDAQRPVRGAVLLADDEELVRFATRRVLEHAGLEVHLAADGQEALDVYGSIGEKIDLVILDLDMPRLNGEQAYQRLRALDPQIRVVISSGYLDRERESALRKAGVDGFLYKPYDSGTLLQAIAKAIRASARK